MDNPSIPPPIVPSSVSTPPSPPPVIPPRPPVFPQPPKKKSFTWLLILVILLLLASTGVLAYQYYQLKTQIANPTPSSSLAPFPTPTPSQDPTADWKTYTNDQYNFATKYNPQSSPNETLGSETTGQFSYLLLIKFGTNPLKFPNGYELTVSKLKSIDEYRSDLVGHNTDKIDSEEEIKINGKSWKKINYQVFITTDNVSVTTAIIESKEFNYSITAATVDIDQILSTFRFIDPSEASGEGG